MKMDIKDIQANDVKTLLVKVYRDLKRGDLSESQAYRETIILSNILKAIEISDFEARLKRIEGLMRE